MIRQVSCAPRLARLSRFTCRRDAGVLWEVLARQHCQLWRRPAVSAASPDPGPARWSLRRVSMWGHLAEVRPSSRQPVRPSARRYPPAHVRLQGASGRSSRASSEWNIHSRCSRFDEPLWHLGARHLHFSFPLSRGLPHSSAVQHRSDTVKGEIHSFTFSFETLGGGGGVGGSKIKDRKTLNWKASIWDFLPCWRLSC